VIIWLGKPDGTYQQTPVRWVLATEGLAGLVPGDFNRDGKIDFATTNVSDSRISVLLNSTPKAACNVSSQFSTVTLCTPQDFTFSNSPAKVAAISTAEAPVVGNPITAAQVYVDNALVFQVNGTQIDTALNMMPGDHFLVTKFFDTAGSTIQAVSHVSMFDGAPGETCATSPNTLTICAPVQDRIFGTPLHVLAAVMSDTLITTLQVYIDNRLVYNDTDLNTYVDTAFDVAAGSHLVEVKAFDVNGVTYRATRNVITQ
jgi:hypothetical protein